MIPFGHFIESATATYRKAAEEYDYWPIPPLEESHVFYLGEDEEFTAAIEDIRLDLHEEMKDGIPMPFKDISVVTIVRKALPEDDEKALVRTILKEEPDSDVLPLIPEGAPVWVMDRLIQIDERHPGVAEMIRGESEAIAEVKQWFIMVRLNAYEGLKYPPLAWIVGYCGVQSNGYVRTLTTPAARPLGSNVVSNLEQVAAISHPANYVVKVTPELSPKEARKVAAGKARPPQKRSHFIVVDHEVLVGMRPDKGGTHASPIPHQRRGHWKRLAERCRHARLMGKDKVWVRPAFIGERTWTDPKALYEVLLDFGGQKAEAK